jgi:hypothetical protein
MGCDVIEPGGGVSRKLSLQFFTEKPAWAILNVTGPLGAWSFGSKLNPSTIADKVRFQGEGTGGPLKVQVEWK